MPGSDNPAFKDEVDVVLEDLVEQCHGNIWHDFLAGLKSPALTTARKALDQAYQRKFLVEGWIDGRALGRKRYWKVGSCSWCGKSLRRDHSKCETAKAAIKKGEG